MKSLWGPMQTRLGTDGEDLERVGPSKQREKAQHMASYLPMLMASPPQNGHVLKTIS